MEVLDFIEQALGQAREATLQACQGLPQDRFRWQPSPKANSAAFLLWHIARVEDFWTNRYIRRQPELWQSSRLYQRFGLPERDTGFGFDVSKLDQFPLPDRDGLLEYMKEVRENTLSYLRSLDAQKLEEVPRPDRPEFTIGRVFRQLICHENQHAGAMEYLCGLMS